MIRRGDLANHVRILVRERDDLCRKIELVAAQRDASLDALSSLVSYVRRTGGFMYPEDQELLRNAIALLAEHGGRHAG